MVLLLDARLTWSLELSNTPFLQRNSWMHTGGITQISLDTNGRYLASSSRDKTIRVWDVATRRVLFVLRPPIGLGREGSLNSVALSPDGRTIVTGGYTKADTSSFSIYIFDAFSHKMIRSLSGQNGEIYFLTYSPDGAFLAVLMGKGTGLRIYRTSDWTLAGEDLDYANKSYWAAFDKQGRLVTSCIDGLLRLYDSSFKLIAKRTVSDNKEPFAVAFSPDNKNISVGFTNSTKIEVLSSRDLSFLYSPITEDVDMKKGNNFSVTTWSADGQVLYAGGRFKVSDDKWAIRYWVEAGHGKGFNVPVARNTINDIRQLPTGGVAFSSLDPSIGFMDMTARPSYVREESEAALMLQSDFRGIGNNLLASDTGEAIGFVYETLGKGPSRFSVSRRTFEASSSPQSRLSPPILKAKGLNIVDWNHSEKPTLNGHPLQIEPQETSRSLAICPDNETFVIGADWNIYLFDRIGKQLWKTTTQSPVWGANVTGNGKLAIATLGDGTIRWYRIRDGHELLALFPHPDRSRWILWTPSGYYDVSIGGEDLIGWHVNQGWDKAADFFPIRLFRDTFLRPDVIANILESADEGEALRSANFKVGMSSTLQQITKQLPPIVHIYTPETTVATTPITVRFGVRSGVPVTNFRVLVNGVPTTTREPYPENKRSEEDQEMILNLVVPIPQKDVKIGVVAENQHGSSQPAEVSFRWDGEASHTVPNLYLLAIGVSTFYFKDKIPSLKSADKDAKDLEEVFDSQKGRLYKNVTSHLLTDKDATRDNIKSEITWLQETTQPGDYAVLFLSGHGTNSKSGEYYFLPYDFNPQKFSVTGISFAEIIAPIVHVNGQVIVMIDTCRSATLFGTGEYDYFTSYDTAVNSLRNPKGDRGITVFFSVTGRGLAREDQLNGEFTRALKEGLRGEAVRAWPDGEVTITRLDDYVSTMVKNRTRGVQEPKAFQSRLIPNFALALK